MIKKIISMLRWNKNLSNENELIINNINETFHELIKLFPDRDMHFYLIETYLRILHSTGIEWAFTNKNIRNNAYSTTYMLSLFPWNIAWRMLWIYMIHELDPNWYKNDPKLSEEFDKHMLPIVTNLEEWTLLKLYKIYNPKWEMTNL